LVKPVTVQGLVALVHVNDPGVEVAVYEVIAEPPFEDGAAKLTVALRLPVAVATTEDGAPATDVVGTTTDVPATTHAVIVCPPLSEKVPSEAIVIFAPLLEVTGICALIIPVEAV